MSGFLAAGVFLTLKLSYLYVSMENQIVKLYITSLKKTMVYILKIIYCFEGPVRAALWTTALRDSSSAGWGCSRAPLQRCQGHSSVFLLALGAVQLVLPYVPNHAVRHQVSDALAAPQRPPHVRGGDVIGHPLVHHVDPLAVAPDHVRLVHGLEGVAAAAGDAHQPEAAHNLGEVLVLPQVGNGEGLQDVGSAQQHHLRALWAWEWEGQI